MWINKHATYLQCYIMSIPNAPAQMLSPCSRVPWCCCQALIAWAELYYTADVVSNRGGGYQL